VGEVLAERLNDQPRSTSPASRTSIPAAKATAPGRIAAAGKTRGVRLATTVVAITQARPTSRPPIPVILVAPSRGAWERWPSSIAPQAAIVNVNSTPATWLVSK
jgi:hypothetical protein